MADDLKNSLKEGVRQSKKLSQETDEEVLEKINEIKEELRDLINSIAKDYDNKVPFEVLHEKTGYDYNIISDVLLNLIMENKLLGFINDHGTEALKDDILIVREERYLDKMEPEYETG